jgi:cell division protein FtsB
VAVPAGRGMPAAAVAAPRRSAPAADRGVGARRGAVTAKSPATGTRPATGTAGSTGSRATQPARRATAPGERAAARRPTPSARAEPVLRLLPGHRPDPSRMPFIVLMLGVLGGGLVVLLLLNSAAAADSFVQARLQQENADLTVREQELGREVAVMEAPGALARQARKLGLVPSGEPGFVMVGRDGSSRVVGTPTPATPPPPPPSPRRPSSAGRAARPGTAPRPTAAAPATRPAVTPTTAPRR